MTILPLSEGSFTIDATKVFVPFDKDTDDLQQRPTGSLLVEVQPFLVISGRHHILLDTGLGFTLPDGEMQIMANLRKYGVDATDITHVLLSHLHRDHAGGVKEKNAEGFTGKLAFPNARYFVHRDELHYALQHAGKSYTVPDFDILENSPQLELLDDAGTIDGIIQYEKTGAHSKYHTVFWISEGSNKVFFGADVAPQLQQMKRRFVAKYDFDGKKSMELRAEWWERGKQEFWTFTFYHDIKTPTYRAAS